MTCPPALTANCVSPPPIRIYGWYDSPDQPCEQPSYDPPLDSACPHCGTAIHARDVRTHTFAEPDADRGYFYRTHRSCAEAADEQERRGVFQALLDRIKHNGDWG